MQLINSVESMAALSLQAPVIFVPTMGALHSGHVALVKRAREIAGADGTVVVSVFVNPTQFGPSEDLDAYPRTLDSDREKCAEAGADILFHPAAGDVYAGDHSVNVTETSLSSRLCGASRPGHFDGVCTVVLKLFNIVRPQTAVFGKKDYQQLAIIRRLVRDLNLPVEIEGVETVREPDGLAKSSRNTYLSKAERAEAPVIRRTLLEAASAFRAGQSNTAALRQSAVSSIRHYAPLSTIDYLEIVDAESLQPVAEITAPALLAAAVFFGTTRLIDNIELASD